MKNARIIQFCVIKYLEHLLKTWADGSVGNVKKVSDRKMFIYK